MDQKRKKDGSFEKNLEILATFATNFCSNKTIPPSNILFCGCYNAGEDGMGIVSGQSQRRDRWLRDGNI